MVELLLEREADVNSKGAPALREAYEMGQKAIMRLSLENNADVSLVFHDE